MTEKQQDKTCMICKYYQNTGFPEEYLCGKTIEWLNSSSVTEKASTCEYYVIKTKI